MSRRILIVEDDAGLAKVMCDNLTVDGFQVKWVGNAQDALTQVRGFAPDLVLLDLMLPGRSGFDLVHSLRQGGRRIIIVSAKSQRTDKVRGLDLGADDYITKPFDLEELVARINAVLRRAAPTATASITLGSVFVDFRSMRATQHSQEIHLTHREMEILRYLADHRGQTVHRDQLLTDVWGVSDGSTTRSVDFAIGRLRKKVEPEPSNPRYIRTVHGDGYCLTADSQS